MKSKKSKIKKASSKQAAQKKVKKEKIKKAVANKLQKSLKLEPLKKGYFKGKLTTNILRAYQKLHPKLTNKQLAKYFSISVKTLTNVSDGKKVRLSTQKKVSKGIDKLNTKENQILIGLIAKHLFRYGNISDKKLNDLKKTVKKSTIKKSIENIKDKGYLFFKIFYEMKVSK